MINNDVFVDKLIIASGGSPKIEGFQWLLDIGLEVEKPCAFIIYLQYAE